MILRVLILVFLLSSPCLNFSQTPISESKFLFETEEFGKHRCGTPPPDAATRKYIFEEIISNEQERALQRNNVTNCLPVKVHIVRETAGTGGLSLGDLAIAFANLNYVFYDADIEFFVCGDINYIDDSDFYDFDETAPDNDDETTFCAPEEVTDAVNVFFMNSLVVDVGGSPFTAAGYAYFPSNSLQANRIFMINSVADNAPNSTFSHELGHYFSLYHTHQDTEFGNMDPDAERVVRTGMDANCTTDGDLLCDTDADPRYDAADFDLGTCSYTGTDQDDLMVTYAPTTAINNIMSYYPDVCGGVFTAGQFTRIGSGLTTRQGHTAYNYTCSAATITAASGMMASESANSMDLSWTDNASNELGYIIERSTTSSSAGFLPIIYGGVGPNVTTFTDDNIVSSTTYWYRVRPVNSACDNYSNVASVTTGQIYCKPSYSSPCTGANSILDDFSMDGDGGADEINNLGSDCSSTSYDDFTNLSAAVTEGNTYSFTACRNFSNTRYLEIWVDWNQDGDFDDGNEQMINSGPTLSPCYTGSITVPAGVSSGTTTMRVIIANSSAPTEPCGAYSFGEAEDYSLSVTGLLPIELTQFEGHLSDENIELAWETATEVNNDFFTLEKSSNGIDFETIAIIEGAGDSQVPLNYSFVDNRPFVGENYYRLKQTDFDGKYTYSEIIVISKESNGDNILNIFPNPIAENEFTLSYESVIEGKIQVQVFDVVGRIVDYRTLEVIKGNNLFTITINDLNSGIYYLKTQYKNESQMVRFVRM